MSLVDKLLKNSTLKNRSSLLSESKNFGKVEFAETSVPIINLALSGKLKGGLTQGLTVIAGMSKNFKTNYGLLMVSSYLNKYKDAICVFYDSEFGVTKEYIQNFGIEMERIIHVPITNVEELKFDLVNQLDNIDKDDKVIFFLDSLGNLASKAELENALNEKSAVDMQRAKHVKSLFRMVTPYLQLKQVPLVVVNHTYENIGSFIPQQIVGGGTGITYSADTIWIISRAQEKSSKGGLEGWTFTITAEKSRFVKEKSKFPVTVKFDTGISKYSGLAELGIELGFLEKSGDSHLNPKTGNKLYLKTAEPEKLDEFFNELLNDNEFTEAVEHKYSLLSAE